MNLFGRPQLVLERGDGAWVWDVDGRRYLDLRRRHRRQRARPRPPGPGRPPCRSRPASSCTSRTSSPRCRRSTLAERLLSLAGAPAGSKVFFCNSGTEALEAAIKLARRTGRTGIVAAEGAFHGRTIGALALTHKPAYREPFEPLIPGVTHVPWGDVDALRGRRHRRDLGPGARADPGRGRRVARAAGLPARGPRDHPRRTARCSCSTRCRPASAAPAPGSPSTRPASCPTPSPWPRDSAAACRSAR